MASSSTINALTADPIFAHGSGHGNLTFNADGTFVLTCGQDKKINVYDVESVSSGQNTTAAASFDCEHGVNAIAYNTELNRVFVAQNDRFIVSIPIDEEKISLGENKCFGEVKIYTKVSSEPSCITTSKSGMLCATSGKEGDISEISTIGELSTNKLRGQKPDGLYLQYDPKEEYLVSANSKGVVRFWDIQKKKSQHQVELKGSFGECEMWQPSWHPDGEFLALPDKSNIKVVKRGTWTSAYYLGEKVKNAPDVTLTAFSPNGLYLASVDADGGIKVWDVTTRTQIAGFEASGDAIQSIEWSPVGNRLGFLTGDGELGFCNDVVPSNMHAPSNRFKLEKAVTTTAKATSETVTAGTVAAKEVAVAATAAIKQDEEENMKNKSNPSPAKTKKKAKKTPTRKKATTSKATSSSSKRKKKKNRVIIEDDDDDDDDDDDEELDANATTNAIKNSLIAAEASSDDDDDDIVDFDLSKITEKYNNPAPPPVVDNSMYEDDESKELEPQVLYAPETSLQNAFQSGETSRDEKHRFMVWNLYGSIVVRTEESYSTIEIEFSNHSKRGQKFPDYTGLEMADLNEHGAVFASRLSEEQMLDEKTNIGSTIKYLPFNSWTHTSELTFNLPARESAVAVAVNDTCFAVGTSTNYLRVFNRSGTQFLPLLLPGKVVTMAAKGSLLAVVYHEASPFTPSQGASQTLGFALYNTNCNQARCCTGLLVKEIASGRLPLTPNMPNDEDLVELFWLGFSDSGMLMAYDTNGVLLSLSPADYKHWIPLLDTRQYNKSSTEFHWPVGISPNRFHFVKCAGPTREKRYPRTRPKPMMSVHDFGVSTVHMTGADPKIEQKLMNKAIEYASNVALVEAGIINRSDDEKYGQFQLDLDKFILKMINIASKEDLHERVIDLANRLQTPKIFDIAIKICRKNRQDTLVEKIYNIQQQRINEKYHKQQQMLATTTVQPQQYQPQQQYAEEVSSYDDSSSSSNDNNVIPLPVEETKSTMAKTSSDSPPLMQNRFQLAAEKRTVKSNKRTITGKNKNSGGHNAAKKHKSGAINPFAKGTRSPEKNKSNGIYNVLNSIRSPSYNNNSNVKQKKLSRQSTFSGLARDKMKNKNVM